MTVKWASFVFWNFINPVFYTHHRYFRQKVVIDRFLESKSLSFNCGVGFVFGIVIYYGIANLSPYILRGEDSRKPMRLTMSRTDDLMVKLTGEVSCEIPMYSVERARYIILSKMCLAQDRMAVKRQREEVAKLNADVAQLREATTSGSNTADGKK